MNTAANARSPVHGLLGGLALVVCLLMLDARGQSARPWPINDLFPAELFAPWPEKRPPESDLVIVFWFNRHDRLNTLQHQVYDRRKGEYTPAVDTWLETIWRDYADYAVDLRYVDVGKRNPAEVVHEAIERERAELLERTVKMQSMKWVSPLRGLDRAQPSPAASRVRHRIGTTGVPGSSRMLPGPGSSYSFPTPFPYPRPHP